MLLGQANQVQATKHGNDGFARPAPVHRGFGSHSRLGLAVTQTNHTLDAWKNLISMVDQKDIINYPVS